MCLCLGGRGDKVEERRISSGSHVPADKSPVHIQDHPRGRLHKGGLCKALTQKRPRLCPWTQRGNGVIWGVCFK